MNRGDVDRVDGDIWFTVESFVVPMGVVDDVNCEILVVPLAGPLTPYLLAVVVRVLSGTTPDALVVGEKRREAGKRAQRAEPDWIVEVPIANFKYVDEVIEVAHEIGGSVLVA